MEEVIILLAQDATKMYADKTENLVLAGGVALNCVANGILQQKKLFKRIWIQPAAGDAGGALGAALYYYWQNSNMERKVDGRNDGQKGSYLGPQFNDDEIEKFLLDNSYPYEKIEDASIFERIAELINQQKVIGIFQGRMEYGPRALGNRSIIADPRSEEMQSRLNLKIKFRESFRPFAPSVLKEKSSDYFDFDAESPYMLFCADVCKARRTDFDLLGSLRSNANNLLPVVNMKRSDIPSVTHVDYSARLQTVSEATNSFYYHVIKSFDELTGCPVVINTSFNVRGEPIVCSPQDAYLCFMRTDMDVVVLGNCILYKENQPRLNEGMDWRKQYALD